MMSPRSHCSGPPPAPRVCARRLRHRRRCRAALGGPARVNAGPVGRARHENDRRGSWHRCRLQCRPEHPGVSSTWRRLVGICLPTLCSLDIHSSILSDQMGRSIRRCMVCDLKGDLRSQIIEADENDPARRDHDSLENVFGLGGAREATAKRRSVEHARGRQAELGDHWLPGRRHHAHEPHRLLDGGPQDISPG